MTISGYSKLKGISYWSAAITNDGSKVVLCGKTIRLFDCRKRFTHMLSKLTNAIVFIFYTQKQICVLNASAKSVITLVESVRDDTSFNETKRITLKVLNTDGGKLYFSKDKKCFFVLKLNNFSVIRAMMEAVAAPIKWSIHF